MPEVVLAHDYLVQVGGAERVVAEWAAGFGARRVVTLAYRPESTLDKFRRLDVQATIPHVVATQVERCSRRCRPSRRARLCRAAACGMPRYGTNSEKLTMYVFQQFWS